MSSLQPNEMKRKPKVNYIPAEWSPVINAFNGFWPLLETGTGFLYDDPIMVNTVLYNLSRQE